MTFPANTMGSFSGTTTGVNPSPNAAPLRASDLNDALGTKVDATGGQLLNPLLQNGSLTGTDSSAATARASAAAASASFRSLSDRFSERLSILDFGAAQITAIGTGGDDQAALQALLNAAAGRAQCYIPAGLTLNISGPLLIPSNTNLVLDGTIKLLPHAVTNNSVVAIGGGVSNISITGIGTIDGNYTQQTGTGLSACIDGLTSANPGATRVYVAGISCINALNWAVNIVFWQDSLVENVYGTGHNSFEMVQSSRVTFLRVTSITVGDGAISIYGGCNECNVIDSYTVGGVSGIGIYSDAAQSLPCVGCSIIGCTTILSGAANASQAGVLIKSKNDGLASHRDCLISDNMVIDDGTSQSVVAHYEIGNVDGLIFSGNMSRYTGASPIAAYSTVMDYPLRDVHFYGNKLCPPGVSENPFIFLHGTSDANNSMVIIENNVLNNDTTTLVAAYAVSNSATASWLTIRDNSISGNVNGVHIGLTGVCHEYYDTPGLNGNGGNKVFTTPVQIGGNTTIAGNVTASGNLTVTNTAGTRNKIVGDTEVDGAVFVYPGALILGKAGTSATPYADWYSSGNTTADARFIVTDGSATAYTGTISILAALFKIPNVELTGSVRLSRSSVAVTGSTQAVPSGVSWFSMTQTATLAALTLTLPSPSDGLTLAVTTQGAVTALTLSPAVVGAPTALAAGQAFTLAYDASIPGWVSLS